MNVLYILGNGFDKAQGMKTSYPEFYEYLKTKEGSSLLEKMKEAITSDKVLWSDMEWALGEYTSKVETAEDMDSLHAELSQHLQKYLTTEDKQFRPIDMMKNKFHSDFIRPESYLSEVDIANYDNIIKPIINARGASKSIHVMTLNYTNTIEKLLGLNNNETSKTLNARGDALRDICHIHGRLGDTIIIGVDNEEQIRNTEFRQTDDIKDFLIKKEANLAMKNLRHSRCEQYVKNANLIVLMGVSWGETDQRWWTLIGSELKKRTDLVLINTIYRPNDVPNTRKYRLATVERDEKNHLYKKLGIQTDEEKKNMSNRLFFAINSSIFKL